MRSTPAKLPSRGTWAVLVVIVTAAHALVLQQPVENLALSQKKASPSPTAQAVPFDTRNLAASLLPAPIKPSVTVPIVATPAALAPVAATPPAPALQLPQPAQADPGTAAPASEAVAAVRPRKTAKQPAIAPSPGAPSVFALLPPSRRLMYDVTGEARKFPYTAHAELLWQQDGGTYNTRLEIGAMFMPSRVQTSQGQITPQGLAPSRFSDKFRSEVAAHFERDKGKVIFSANTPEASLQPGAQDRLSVLLQLAGLLAGEPARYPAGSSLSMQTIGPRDADEWRFVVGAEENLALGNGSHPTRKLSRAPQRDFDLQVDVWLALDMGYLPVQLRMTQPNGDFVQLQLRSAEIP